MNLDFFEKAVEDHTVLEQLSLDDVECVEGCNISWEYSIAEERFHGTTQDTCRFTEERNVSMQGKQ